jgi:hypothetical protein
MAKITVTWEIDEGYCGGSRPKITSFESHDHEDENWEDLTEEKKQGIIDQEVEQDYRNNYSFSITNVTVT